MADVNALKATPVFKGPRRVRALIAGFVVVVALVGYAAWRHMVRPVSGRLADLVQQIAADPAAFPTIDSRNLVSLTGRFSGITPHDEMFLTRRSDGSFMALIPTYYGNGTSIACLLYTSRPLVESDTYMRQATLGRTERVIDVPPYMDMKFDGRVDEHWYRVSYLMH